MYLRCGKTTSTVNPLAHDQKFHGSHFHGGQSIHENNEILHHAKISLYTVPH